MSALSGLLPWLSKPYFLFHPSLQHSPCFRLILLFGKLVIHLDPDLLECEVKWAFGSITMNKASGDDGIPAELFKILKDEAVKLLHCTCYKLGKLSSGHSTGKGQFSFQSQRRAMPRDVQTLYIWYEKLCSFHILPGLCFEFFKYGFSST